MRTPNGVTYRAVERWLAKQSIASLPPGIETFAGSFARPRSTPMFFAWNATWTVGT
ncbi:MAG: hypothetical protein ACJ8J7_14510 [Sulfurifustaceae bacterium]